MALHLLALGLCTLVLVDGNTPTFRNEATHPLKAPTQSTLGLQMNDETATRTRSNVPKTQETVFSGGKHFEYMMLNDSNILLTSLQNDGPFDAVAAQFASSKQKTSRKGDQTAWNTTTDSEKSVQIEATLPPNNVSVPNRSNMTVRIISKTNFKIEPPVKISRHYIENGTHSQEVPPNVGTIRQIDVSSTTTLYSKGANHSQKDFASFTAPLKTTKFLVNPLENLQASKSASSQSYDYDDTFTKLLISNGILRPDNQSIENSNSSPAAQETTSTLNFTNRASSRGSISYNVGIIAPDATIKNETTECKNSSLELCEDYTPAGTTVEDVEPLTSIAVNGSIDSRVVDTSNQLSHSSLHFDKKAQKGVDDSNTQNYKPSEQDRITNNYSSAVPANVPNENPLRPSIKPSTTSETDKDKSSRNLVYKLARSALSGESVSFDKVSTFQKVAQKKPPAIDPLEGVKESFSRQTPSLHNYHGEIVVHPKMHRADLKQLTFPEFKNALTLLVKKLFNSVTDYVNKLNKLNSSYTNNAEQNSSIFFKNFVLFNVTMAAQSKLKEFFSTKGDQQPILMPPSNPMIACTFPWTNLRDNQTVNVGRRVNDLFDDDSADFYWFGLPLMQRSPYEMLRKGTFFDIFETEFAVRMYLEYENRKIEAVFVLPRALTPNMSLTGPDLTVDVNERVQVDPMSSEVKNVHQFLDSNATMFQFAEQKYHILELGTSKLIPPKAMAKIWVFSTEHEDIETFINITLGSLCTFCFLSVMLYCLYRFLQNHPPIQSFRVFLDRYRFLERERSAPRDRQESLNVIFSENFDSKFENASWLDNSRHMSAILKPHEEIREKTTHFVDRIPRDRCFGESAVGFGNAVNSPRLNKENKLAMLGCRSYCILLPHARPYGDDDPDKRCFENPNYVPEIR